MYSAYGLTLFYRNECFPEARTRKRYQNLRFFFGKNGFNELKLYLHSVGMLPMLTGHAWLIAASQMGDFFETWNVRKRHLVSRRVFHGRYIHGWDISRSVT